MPVKLPTTFILFGATGDLARRKLIPELFRLYQKKQLPDLFQVVAFSRQELDDIAFRSRVREILAGEKNSAVLVERFSKLFSYQQGFFDRKSGYDALSERLGFQDQEWKVCANKLFYLAVPPQYYKRIFKLLAASGLTHPCSPEEGWTRIVVEKPFGKDSKTAQELDLMLGQLFREDQIYRIDHFLGKETVQNILAFRFSNSLFEEAWDKDSIERISVEFLESGGIEERGEFYDSIGALRDVGQNHLLQLLALFAMENPGKFDGDSIRRERASILRALKILSPSELSSHTLRGQYAGYSDAPGVKSGSRTETYFRIKTFLETPRWQGIPIYLESGKKLGENRAEVLITFRHPKPCLCPDAARGVHYQNVLRYQIQPRQGASISFWVKKPGTRMELEEKEFEFDYQKAYSEEQFVAPYEKLLLDVMTGDQTLFVSTEEIAASWKFIDPIVRGWQKNRAPLRVYAAPEEILKPLLIEKTAEISPQKKEIILIGLGKMGKNMKIRLEERGWIVHGFDQDKTGLADALAAEARPRIVWLMIPAGKSVDDVLDELTPLLEKNDIVIDGGNSFYEDSMRRARKLAKLGIHFLDVGVSGGPEGARNGTALLIGGDHKVFQSIEPLFRELAIADGYAYIGKSGAGHFAKMVHNGIEYGMMQAIAEGFSVMKKTDFRLDLKKISEVYNHGSVIESRLIHWLKKAYEEHGENLEDISGSVGYTGEGEWTVKTASKLDVETPVIKDAFRFRVKSKKNPSYTGKILTALRNQFGGHSTK